MASAELASAPFEALHSTNSMRSGGTCTAMMSNGSVSNWGSSAAMAAGLLRKPASLQGSMRILSTTAFPLCVNPCRDSAALAAAKRRTGGSGNPMACIPVSACSCPTHDFENGPPQQVIHPPFEFAITMVPQGACRAGHSGTFPSHLTPATRVAVLEHSCSVCTRARSPRARGVRT